MFPSERPVLIRNGLVITFIHEGYHSIKMKYADLLVEHGVFSRISEQIDPAEVPGCEVYDAAGRWVLPGLVNTGSRCAAAKLLGGLLPDYPRQNWRGSMFYHRSAPMLELAGKLLSFEEQCDLLRWGFSEAIAAGSTTLVEQSSCGFADAARAVAQELGVRAFIVDSAAVPGLPQASQEGYLLCPEGQGGALAAPAREGLVSLLPGLHSLECASPELLEQARAAVRERPFFLSAGYSRYEEQLSWQRYGRSPVGALCDLGLLSEHTVLLDPFFTDFYDRERIRTAHSHAAFSAVGALQDALPNPAVSMLRQDINTALGTGWYGVSMLDEMRAAAWGAKLDTGLPQQYQASDAFYAATIAGAAALGEPLGRIEPGFAADLLIVDPVRLAPHNYPLIQLVYGGQPQDIEAVMVAGRFLHIPGQPAGQTRQLAARATAAAEKVWAKARETIL